MEGKYIVAGRQPWNRQHFRQALQGAPGRWVFVSTPEELQEHLASETNWTFVFFLHWSEKVSEEVDVPCVCFHMTDVPFGRGGSPLQNLIARGIRETKLTALRMTPEFDAGPVLLKRALSLEGSSAEEVYMRASRLSCQMALEIARDRPTPVEQEGEVVVFRRRKPDESRMAPDLGSLEDFHDHIRMLDAEGYPPAFLDLGGYRIEFRRSTLYEGRVEASVRIVPWEAEE